MRKLILFVAVMMVGSFTWGQNWQCVQANVIRHYNGIFVRVMNIDSVQTINNDVVFYPFHTPRGSYTPNAGIGQLDTNGGSWLGKKIILKQDGTMLFDTYWGDTVFINTTAIVGDSWTFYNDTSSRYYLATITAIDTATVLNSLDSIKTIAITAYDNGVLNISDIAHNQTIILSKNHGFFKSFSVYTFPFHPAQFNTYQQLQDYILDRRDVVNNVVQSYTLFHLAKPSWSELHDINAGDVFEYWGFYGVNLEQYWKLDSVMTKTQIAPNSFTYSIKQKVRTQHAPDNNHPSYYYTLDSSIVTGIPASGLVIDTNSYEESDLKIYLDDSQFCFHSTFIGIGDGFWDGLSLEPCSQSKSYKYGMDQISELVCTDPSGTSNFGWGLIYAKKNNVGCGNYVSLVGINDFEVKSQIFLSPNPTTGIITIKGLTQLAVAVYNLMGEKVVDSQGSNEVNLAQLPTGMYLVQVFNKDMELVKSEKVIKE